MMTNHHLYIQVTGSREIGDAHRTQDKDPTGPAGYKVSMIMVMMTKKGLLLKDLVNIGTIVFSDNCNRSF